MIIYVDVDETICSNPETSDFADLPIDYTKAVPLHQRIKHINSLFEKGHTIVYWTARGRVTKIDWYKITKNQLDSWGAKYHQLDLETKPHYDLLICDKTLKSIDEVNF